MAKRSRRLTLNTLKRMVNEEKKKLKQQGVISSDTVEDAWAGGDNLVNRIDYIKKLGIVESNLRKKAAKISRTRAELKKRLIKEL